VKDSYKKFDCALDFGAGLEYSIAPLIKANLDYKYSLGLLNIDNTNFTPTHTRGNQIFASILFSI
jgi:opacity protein-like surface antigen